MIPGITKNNPLQWETPGKDWKDFIETNKELIVAFVSFLNDIKPWMKVFLGSASFMMVSTGLTFWRFMFV